MIEKHSGGEEPPAAAKNSSEQEDSELELARREIEQLEVRLAALKEEQKSKLRDTRAQLEGIAENLPGIIWRMILHPNGSIT